MDRFDQLTALIQFWNGCEKCELSRQRKHVVVGEGNPHSRIMIVGEAPGHFEDLSGLPFVGLSGNLLDNLLAETTADQRIDQLNAFCKTAKGEDRERHCRSLRDLLWPEFFFTNILGCHPPEDRDPLPSEVEACGDRLRALIYLVDPALILAFGKEAVATLLGKRVKITQVKGEMYDIEFMGRAIPYRIPMIALLHPAYLLRRNDFRSKEGDGAKTFESILQAMRIQDEFDFFHFDKERPKQRPLSP